MTSIGKMIERIDGLRGTKDVTAWEDRFIENVFNKYSNAGRDSSALSDKQVETVENIFNKHFA